MSARRVAGTSLVELVVALALLELLAVASLHAVLQSQRIARRVAAGSAVDLWRLEFVRHAAAAPGCRNAAMPTVQPLALPAMAHRAATVAHIRCGP